MIENNLGYWCFRDCHRGKVKFLIVYTHKSLNFSMRGSNFTPQKGLQINCSCFLRFSYTHVLEINNSYINSTFNNLSLGTNLDLREMGTRHDSIES